MLITRPRSNEQLFRSTTELGKLKKKKKKEKKFTKTGKASWKGVEVGMDRISDIYLPLFVIETVLADD